MDLDHAALAAETAVFPRVATKPRTLRSSAIALLLERREGTEAERGREGGERDGMNCERRRVSSTVRKRPQKTNFGSSGDDAGFFPISQLPRQALTFVFFLSLFDEGEQRRPLSPSFFSRAFLHSCLLLLLAHLQAASKAQRTSSRRRAPTIVVVVRVFFSRSHPPSTFEWLPAPSPRRGRGQPPCRTRLLDRPYPWAQREPEMRRT